MKKISRLIAYTLFSILVVCYWLYPPPNQNINIKGGHEWENYDPALFYKVQSTNDLIQLADDSVGKENRHTVDYVRCLSRTVAYRFFHGYSAYSFRHNWMAFLAGRFVWSDLNAIVIPDDILKHPQAACSQVSIVLADALRKIGVPYRKVGLKGHFALEAAINGKWYFFDPNLEAKFPKGRKSLAELIRNKELYAGYEDHITHKQVVDIFSNIQYGMPNAPLAPNATLFHKVTFMASILTAIGLLIFVVVDLIRIIVYRKGKQLKVGKRKNQTEVRQTAKKENKSFETLHY